MEVAHEEGDFEVHLEGEEAGEVHPFTPLKTLAFPPSLSLLVTSQALLAHVA